MADRGQGVLDPELFLEPTESAVEVLCIPRASATVPENWAVWVRNGEADDDRFGRLRQVDDPPPLFALGLLRRDFDPAIAGPELFGADEADLLHTGTRLPTEA